ncbi:Uncharacterised protein [Shigella sonnei]|nr:Uncharacterised protein [Shigella sonnei]
MLFYCRKRYCIKTNERVDYACRSSLLCFRRKIWHQIEQIGNSFNRHFQCSRLTILNKSTR